MGASDEGEIFCMSNLVFFTEHPRAAETERERLWRLHLRQDAQLRECLSKITFTEEAPASTFSKYGWVAWYFFGLCIGALASSFL